MIQIDKVINEEKGYLTLSIGGEVDASSSIFLETALKEAMADTKKILVDLSELDYISSAGLGVFMSVIQRLEDEKISLVLYGMKQKVLDVFEILGLHQLLVVKQNIEEAEKAL
jgi:anti-sigma B factor antagonist